MRWKGLEPALVPYAERALAMAARAGIQVKVTSTRRNWAQQEELYSRYRAGLSSLPANPPGESPHQWGVAWDSSVPPHQQAAWDQIRAAIGWKLYPHDPVHAELPNWRAYKPRLSLT